MQVRRVLHTAVQRLQEAGIPEPELEAALLLANVLLMDRTTVLLAGEKTVSPEQQGLFEENLARRLAREPLAYIIGEKEFWSLPFSVSSDVLIPRPETEFLLEKVFAKLNGAADNPVQHGKILDLGTGSGVLAVIMALKFKSARIIAVDCSFRALKVARDNAKRHKVAERIDFINCSWFEGIGTEVQFDLIISNPPYIASDILAKPYGLKGSLQPEVGNFEPRLALDGGERGTEAIQKISLGLDRILRPGGWFFMEIGADQKQEVLEIFSQSCTYSDLEVLNDYAGLARIFQARKN